MLLIDKTSVFKVVNFHVPLNKHDIASLSETRFKALLAMTTVMQLKLSIAILVFRKSIEKQFLLLSFKACDENVLFHKYFLCSFIHFTKFLSMRNQCKACAVLGYA